MCYHHPTWYLNAAYLQLTAAQQAKMPKPLRIEDAGSEGCDRETVERGMQINLYDKTVTKVVGDIEGAINAGVETIKQISFAATNIVSNVTGAAITEGDYYIKSYATTNGLGLNEQNGIRNGSDMKLTTAKSKVKIKKFGSIGYSIEYGTIEGKSYVLDSESESLLNSGSSQIQLWEKNNFLGVSANQRWLFINLEGNKYLIKNLANGKLLDANNDNLTTNSCRVKTYKPRNNDQTQIWVVEKAN